MKTGKFSIDMKLWNRFKQIKPTQIEGCYYENVLTWELDSFTTEEVLSLAKYLHIFFRLIDKEDLEEADVKYFNTYLYLLKSVCLDTEEHSDKYISIGDKRPFGNSYIASDIAGCIELQYINYLKSSNINLLCDNEDDINFELIKEVPYIENNNIEYLNIVVEKINVNSFMKEFNDFIIEMLQKADFKFHQYETLEHSTYINLCNNLEITGIQREYSVYYYSRGSSEISIFPSKVYNREKFIDNVLK